MEITKEIIHRGQFDMGLTLGISTAALVLLFLCIFKWESMEGAFASFIVWLVFGALFLSFAFLDETYTYEAVVTDYTVVQEEGYRIVDYRGDNTYILKRIE